MSQEIGEPVTFAALTTPALGGRSARARLARILHAIRLPLRSSIQFERGRIPVPPPLPLLAPPVPEGLRSKENTPRFFTAFFRFALPAVLSHRPPVSAGKSWRPLPVPSEDHSQQEATTALNSNAKGDGNGTAIIKKKP